MASDGPPDFFAEPESTGASQPPEETANPFGAPAPEGSTAAEVPAAAPAEDATPPGPEPTGAMDPDLFTAPAADSYAPAGTGTDGQTADTEGADARVAWRSKNAKALEKREEEEKKSNQEVKETAQKWLKQFNEGRSKRIAQDKKENAAQESATKMGPTGDTDWAKVNSMVDFTFKPPQERETERERFKKLLFAAKDKNVPVKA